MLIKGSWEAILPSYEWLLLDGIDYDEGWCASETWPWWRVVWDFTLHNNTSEKNSLWWRVVWGFTLHNNTSEKNSLWWRVVWDFTLHNNTSENNWLWWRVVWDSALHNNTSEKNWLWWRVVWDFRSGDKGKWWRWEVVTKGSGDACILHGLCFGEEAGARNLVFFRVKWLQRAMKGTSSVRRVRLGSFLSRIVPPMCFATSGCSCVRSSMRFLKLWLQIALEWLHECCMGYVLGRKPEHETLCFSV